MNRIDLDGRIAIGHHLDAARGIGRAIAERFSASGAKVAIWDVDGAAAAATSLAIENATYDIVDVTDPAGIARAVEAIEARFGAPDILVNNAGISGPNLPLADYPPEEWRRVVEIDLIGVFNCCRAFLPLMQRRDYGRIVNIASIAGKEGNPNASAYSAAKAGVIGLTKSLGKELAGSRIRVNCVTPAAARTDIFRADDARRRSTTCCRRSRSAGLSSSKRSRPSSRGSPRKNARFRLAVSSTSPAAGRLTRVRRCAALR